jgi:putative restriction endonuclease
VMRLVRGRRNQQRFKLEVLHRYGGQCALCDVAAPELVQAAHLVPDSDRGSRDPRNGLPLCSNHHLALDRGLVGVEPLTHAILMLEGHSPGAVGVVRNDLDHLPAQLASEALLYRWNQRANTT